VPFKGAARERLNGRSKPESDAGSGIPTRLATWNGGGMRLARRGPARGGPRSAARPNRALDPHPRSGISSVDVARDHPDAGRRPTVAPPLDVGRAEDLVLGWPRQAWSTARRDGCGGTLRDGAGSRRLGADAGAAWRPAWWGACAAWRGAARAPGASANKVAAQTRTAARIRRHDDALAAGPLPARAAVRSEIVPRVALTVRNSSTGCRAGPTWRSRMPSLCRGSGGRYFNSTMLRVRISVPLRST